MSERLHTLPKDVLVPVLPLVSPDFSALPLELTQALPSRTELLYQARQRYELLLEHTRPENVIVQVTSLPHNESYYPFPDTHTVLITGKRNAEFRTGSITGATELIGNLIQQGIAVPWYDSADIAIPPNYYFVRHHYLFGGERGLGGNVVYSTFRDGEFYEESYAEGNYVGAGNIWRPTEIPLHTLAAD